MAVETQTGVSADRLHRRLARCHLTTSPLAPGFSLERMFAGHTACRMIKENDRRQIYLVDTPHGGYFVKISTLIRPKDRWRHRLLPHRRWSEWRNLHRLHAGGVAAARPVLRGCDQDHQPRMFFVLTEQVLGRPLEVRGADDMRQMGAYTAWLHGQGVFHLDLHPDNVILTPGGQIRLVDVQQVFYLPWIPRWLRARNLGKIYFNLLNATGAFHWAEAFVAGYNDQAPVSFSTAAVKRAAEHHQRKKFNSRAKRCLRNSTEFALVNDSGVRGYKRRSFHWGARELQLALKRGQSLKGTHVIFYQGVCLKCYPRRLFHQNRCLTSWKMSRALAVRGIATPPALGYFAIHQKACFASEYLHDGVALNTYLSSLSDERIKRRTLKQLAAWMRQFHDTNLWQRDFKSENILCRNGDFFMVDLDGVRIRPLRESQKITNLAQLNASVSRAVTIKDRLRFYHYYSAGLQDLQQRPQRRAVYRRVWAITRTKGTASFDLDPDQLLKQITGH